MSSDSKFVYIVVLVVIALSAVVFFFGNSNSSKQTGDTVAVSTAEGWKVGPEEAKVKIVEFADFQCPSCAQSAPIIEEVIAAYPTDVQYIFRHFPLNTHRNSLTSAQAAEAAGQQGKFMAMHDLLFAQQTSWESSTAPEEYFESYANEIGLDLNKYKSDYNSSALKDNVTRDRDYGLSLSVNSTPTFFVNGQRFTGGRTLESWRAIIDPLLK